MIQVCFNIHEMKYESYLNVSMLILKVLLLAILP